MYIYIYIIILYIIVYYIKCHEGTEGEYMYGSTFL